MSDSNNGNTILPVYKDQRGHLTTSTHLTEQADTQRCEVRIKPYVMPILFVPGIMGSNLKFRDVWSDKEEEFSLEDSDVLATMPVEDAWQPPTGIGEKLGAVISGLFRTKEDRRREMNPDVAFVDWENKIRFLPAKMTSIERPQPMSNPDADHEASMDLGDSEEQPCKKPFQTEETLTDKQRIHQEARLRGWGTVYQESYTPFMAFLEDTLNNIPALASLEEYEALAQKDVWQLLLPLFKPEPETSAAANGGAPAHQAAQPDSAHHRELAQWLQKAADYEFRVYGCGYNWLRDNFESGNEYKRASVEHFESRLGSNKKYGPSDLNSRIQTILKECRQTDSRCQQVLILTHSMGGLVARAYAKEQEGKHIAGIYHNVMPATGAPAFYKRLKAGFGGEGFASWISSPIFGYSAHRVTPVLLNSPAAMQLMPWPEYTVPGENSNRWLKIAEMANPEHAVFDFNTNELLADTRHWYSLLPDVYQSNNNGLEQKNKEEWNADKKVWDKFDPRINPGGLVSPIKEFKALSSAQRLKEIVEKVKKFQTTHAGFYHPGKTNMAYSVDEKHKSWNSISWLSKEPLSGISRDQLLQARLLDEKQMYKGKITLVLPNGSRLSLQLSKAKDKGDGTVPVGSGSAPAGKVARVFEESGYDHQNSYGNKSPSRYSALFSILSFTAQQP